MRIEHGRDMAKHSLQAHVRRFAGGFDFAADMEIPYVFVAFELRHCDGRVLTFADILEFVIRILKLTILADNWFGDWQIAAARYELPWNWRNLASEPNGQRSDGSSQNRCSGATDQRWDQHQ